MRWRRMRRYPLPKRSLHIHGRQHDSRAHLDFDRTEALEAGGSVERHAGSVA